MKLEYQYWNAVRAGDLSVIQSCVESGVDINLQDETNSYGVLHYFSQAGMLDHIKEIVKMGGDINKPSTSHGWTPFNLAVWNGHYECVSYLLSKGANIDMPSPAEGCSNTRNLANKTGDHQIINLIEEFQKSLEERKVLDSFIEDNGIEQNINF